MTARQMHYDFKQKLNALDSQKYRNLEVPEIDWKLNEAQELFVKMIAEPRLQSQLGFEVNQRTLDDIRLIVRDQRFNEGVVPVAFDTDKSSYIAALPSDYWFYAKTVVYAKKGTCEARMRKVKIMQHDDEHEESPFDRSSFEWRVVNVRFNKEGLRVFTDKTFEITKVCYEYLIQPKYIHNAQDFGDNGEYELEGTVLTGSQNCELPSGVHREIVDLAVFVATNDIPLPLYSLKKDKLNINN